MSIVITGIPDFKISDGLGPGDELVVLVPTPRVLEVDDKILIDTYSHTYPQWKEIIKERTIREAYYVDDFYLGTRIHSAVFFDLADIIVVNGVDSLWIRNGVSGILPSLYATTSLRKGYGPLPSESNMYKCIYGMDPRQDVNYPLFEDLMLSGEWSSGRYGWRTRWFGPVSHYDISIFYWLRSEEPSTVYTWENGLQQRLPELATMAQRKGKFVYIGQLPPVSIGVVGRVCRDGWYSIFSPNAGEIEMWIYYREYRPWEKLLYGEMLFHDGSQWNRWRAHSVWRQYKNKAVYNIVECLQRYFFYYDIVYNESINLCRESLTSSVETISITNYQVTYP